MAQLDGKVAIVTGGASGIGAACSKTLAREGAKIVVTDIDEAGGANVVAAITDAGGAAIFLAQDVADEPRWIEVAAEIDRRYGRLDVVVANAGIGIGAQSIVDVTLAEWRKLTAINLDGVFLTVKHCLPLMRRAGNGGSIIMMSSIAGLRGSPTLAGYCATKGGVRLFAKSIAMECAGMGDGIRVNSVHPGIIATPIWEKIPVAVAPGGGRNAPVDPREYGKLVVPLGVAGEAEDIADGVLFLASDQSRHMTGSELVIDGGITAGGAGEAPAVNPRSNTIDPITLEVLRNGLESIADEMGVVLKRTSFSPNIKERMDASCAVFDAAAQLVAQAEHVPVHLGSMLRAVKATVAAAGPVDDGDVVIVNDPFTGGSHLPDITLVAPVYAAEGQNSRHLGYVATRAHHADVGGMEPGSMPGNSREIYQEGIVIPAVKLYRRGELQDDVLRLILANVRTADERRGDLNAQLASLRVGEQGLKELAARHGADGLTAGFDAILDYAERRMRRRLAELPPGTYSGEDFLDDDGTDEKPVRIALKVTVSPDRLVLDFTGSSPQCRGNINAVAPMTYSGSFFAVKILTDPEIPVNAGTFRPIELNIPEGSFLAAQPPAATCAGNTETTQRIADTVLKVFAQFAPDRIPAASQGTMNTVAIGGRDPRDGRAYSYIETIGGGQGGRPMGNGDDGIQCNMTNTMNTPIEALEITYPLRVERYELRDGSAGAGRHRGGEGLVRAIRAVGGEARVSLQCERRRFAPYGLHGGADGARGRNSVVHGDGRTEEVPGKASLTLEPGAIVVVETPGGGGWGRA